MGFNLAKTNCSLNHEWSGARDADAFTGSVFLIRGRFRHWFGVIFVQFAQQESMIGPHRAGERVIFAVADGRGSVAAQVRIHPEAQRIADNLNPEVAARIGGSPAKDNQRIEFLKAAATFERVAIERFQHLSQAAILKHMPGVFALSLALRLLSLVNERLIEHRTILICYFFHPFVSFQKG